MPGDVKLAGVCQNFIENSAELFINFGYFGVRFTPVTFTGNYPNEENLFSSLKNNI